MKKKFLASFQRAWISLANHNRIIALSQPEKLFLILAFPFGIIFLFLSAPFQAPDEHNHFYRSYAISTGQFTGLEATIPQSVFDFSQTVSKDLPGNDQNRQSKKALLNEFYRKFEAQPEIKRNIINSAIVSPLPYLPQTVGVFIGRVLKINPILIFYLGRLTNLLTWLGLTYLAIRITPLHPRLFLALALMPMTLHQAASNSPDASIIAISFLFIAYALRILMDQSQSINWFDWGIISLLTIAVALCKSVYILAAGVLLAIPLRRFRYQRAVLPLTLVVICLGIISGLLWLGYSSQIVSVKMMTSSRTPTTAGILYIIQNPQVGGPILWRSALTYIGPQLRMFIGVLGWVDTVLPNWIYPIYYALLIFVVVFEQHSQVFFYIRERLWMAFLAIAAGVTILAIFFYPEVTVGNGIVDLAQGRYYIPFGPFYFLPLSQKKWYISEKSPIWQLIAILHGVVLLVSVRAMLWRYYNI